MCNTKVGNKMLQEKGKKLKLWGTGSWAMGIIVVNFVLLFVLFSKKNE